MFQNIRFKSQLLDREQKFDYNNKESKVEVNKYGTTVSFT